MAEWGWPCAIVPGFSIGVPGQNEISKQIDSLRRQEKKTKREIHTASLDGKELFAFFDFDYLLEVNSYLKKK